jgi:hypothetical protein
MTPMLEALIADRLQPNSAGAGLFRRVLKITGTGRIGRRRTSPAALSKWLTGADSDRHDDSGGDGPD